MNTQNCNYLNWWVRIFSTGKILFCSSLSKILETPFLPALVLMVSLWLSTLCDHHLWSFHCFTTRSLTLGISAFLLTLSQTKGLTPIQSPAGSTLLHKVFTTPNSVPQVSSQSTAELNFCLCFTWKSDRSSCLPAPRFIPGHCGKALKFHGTEKKLIGLFMHNPAQFTRK